MSTAGGLAQIGIKLDAQLDPSFTALQGEIKKIADSLAALLNVVNSGALSQGLKGVANAFGAFANQKASQGIYDVNTVLKNLQNTSAQFNITSNQTTQNIQRIAAETKNTHKAMSSWRLEWGQLIKMQLEWYAGRALIFGIYNAVKNAIVGSMEFEKSLVNVAILAGRTKADLDTLGESVHRLGQEFINISKVTIYSADSIAKAGQTLAAAGLDLDQISEVMPKIALLSQATMSELGTSVDLVTSILYGFDIEASKTGEVVDFLTQAVNATKLTIDGLRTSMQYVGPTAHQLGESLQDTTVWLGMLSNAGFSFSRQGTALNQMMTSLIKPTEKAKKVYRELGLTVEQMNPEFNDLRDIMTDLANAHANAAQMSQIFTVYGARAARVIVAQMSVAARDGKNAFDELSDKIVKAGISAKDLADKQIALSLANQFEILKNNVHALLMEFYDAGNAMNKSSGPLEKMLTNYISLRGVLATVLLVFNKLLSTINFIDPALRGLIVSLLTLKLVLISVHGVAGAMGGSTGFLATVFKKLSAAATISSTTIGTFADRMNAAAASAMGLGQSFAVAIPGFALYAAALAAIGVVIIGLIQRISEKRLQEMQSIIASTKEYAKHRAALMDLKDAMAVIPKSYDEAKDKLDRLTESLKALDQTMMLDGKLQLEAEKILKEKTAALNKATSAMATEGEYADEHIQDLKDELQVAQTQFDLADKAFKQKSALFMQTTAQKWATEEYVKQLKEQNNAMRQEEAIVQTLTEALDMNYQRRLQIYEGERVMAIAAAKTSLEVSNIEIENAAKRTAAAREHFENLKKLNMALKEEYEATRIVFGSMSNEHLESLKANNEALIKAAEEFHDSTVKAYNDTITHLNKVRDAAVAINEKLATAKAEFDRKVADMSLRKQGYTEAMIETEHELQRILKVQELLAKAEKQTGEERMKTLQEIANIEIESMQHIEQHQEKANEWNQVDLRTAKLMSENIELTQEQALTAAKAVDAIGQEVITAREEAKKLGKTFNDDVYQQILRAHPEINVELNNLSPDKLQEWLRTFKVKLEEKAADESNKPEIQAKADAKKYVDRLQADIDSGNFTVNVEANPVATGEGQHAATGGWIGGPPGRDVVPAWLTAGEFVVNAESASQNAALLEKINRSPMPQIRTVNNQSATTYNVHMNFPSAAMDDGGIRKSLEVLIEKITKGRMPQWGGSTLNTYSWATR